MYVIVDDGSCTLKGRDFNRFQEDPHVFFPVETQDVEFRETLYWIYSKKLECGDNEGI